MEVGKRLVAFDSLCGATSMVTKHLTAYYSCFLISTGLLLSLRSLNGVAKCVLAFDSLCVARMGVAKHILAFYSVWGG